jgi:glutathione S-transferase
MNPFGQVPVLADGDVFISDSNAILVYLAKKAGQTEWLPEDAKGAAEVQRWLSVAAGEIAYGPAAARLVTVFGAKFNPEEVIGRAHTILGRIESQLQGREWLVGNRPTIADVAIYSYVARAPEGNVDLSAYPSVNALLRRVEQLPGFVDFVKTPVGLAA